MTTTQRIADRLEAIRRSRGIAVSALPDLSGIADKTLRRRFGDPGKFTFAEFERLCAAFDVRPDDVLNFDIDVETLTGVAA